MPPFRLSPLALVVALTALPVVEAYVPPGFTPSNRQLVVAGERRGVFLKTAAPSSALYVSSTARDDDAFAAFADSLAEESPNKTTSKSTASSSSRSTTATSRRSSSSSINTNTAKTSSEEEKQSWQAAIDELLDPMTSLARRQALLAQLAKSNQDIQQSVITALRDRKVRFLICMHIARRGSSGFRWMDCLFVLFHIYL